MHKTEGFSCLSFGVPENEVLFTCFRARESLIILIAQVHHETIQPMESLHGLGVYRLSFITNENELMGKSLSIVSVIQRVSIRILECSRKVEGILYFFKIQRL